MSTISQNESMKEPNISLTFTVTDSVSVLEHLNSVLVMCLFCKAELMVD